MVTKPLIVRPGERSAPLNVVGTQIVVLASERQTPELQVTLQRGEAGSGPPPHSHPWSESFYVIRGSVLFSCDGVSELCSAGTLVCVPAGAVHAFAYGPEGGEMLEMTGPNSQSSRMFTALDREIPPGPPDLSTVVRVLGEFDARVHL